MKPAFTVLVALAIVFKAQRRLDEDLAEYEAV